MIALPCQGIAIPDGDFVFILFIDEALPLQKDNGRTFGGFLHGLALLGRMPQSAGMTTALAFSVPTSRTHSCMMAVLFKGLLGRAVQEVLLFQQADGGVLKGVRFTLSAPWLQPEVGWDFKSRRLFRPDDIRNRFLEAFYLERTR